MAIYVYMLRCADNSYYVGSATGDDLQPRIDQPIAVRFPAIRFAVALSSLFGPNVLIELLTGSQPSVKSRAGAAPKKKHSSSRTGLKSAACHAAAANRSHDNQPLSTRTVILRCSPQSGEPRRMAAHTPVAILRDAAEVRGSSESDSK
jgi:hypothetical protein